MESLSRVLSPFKDVVGQVAGIVTIAQFLSGTFVCKDIYKKGSTEGISSLPFIGGIVVGILMLKYGLLLGDSTMIIVNVAAILLNVIYTAFYYLFSRDKQQEVQKPLSVGVAVIAVVLGYAMIEDPKLLEYRFGITVTVLMLALMGSPLKDLKVIISNEDASSIPFPLTFMGLIVSFLWLLYGIIIMNSFMLFQNTVGLILCLSQLILIFKYPGQPRAQGKKKKRVVKKD